LSLANNTKTEHQSIVAIDLSHPDCRAPLTQIVALQNMALNGRVTVPASQPGSFG
jgi:hypothetical protein